MKFRIAATVLALALPICAQETTAPKVESVFYKAFYLEKGKRDFAGAMALYEQFLAKAPNHKLAKEAAKQQFRLLDRTGKTEQRDAFKAKYKELLGNLADAPTGATRSGRGEGDRPERGQRGQGGNRRGGMRSMMRLMRGDTKVADMSEEQMQQLKDGVDGASQLIDRMRERMGDEKADKIQASVDGLKKALDGGKMEEAQKALEGLRESFGGMGGRRGNRGQGGEGRGEGRRRRGAGGEGDAGKKKEGGGDADKRKKREGGGGGGGR